MASYWRLMQHKSIAADEAVRDVPDVFRAEAYREAYDAAYPEEWATWKRGLDRLMEIYGVPEGPEPHQTHTEERETASSPTKAYAQASLL